MFEATITEQQLRLLAEMRVTIAKVDTLTETLNTLASSNNHLTDTLGAFVTAVGALASSNNNLADAVRDIIDDTPGDDDGARPPTTFDD